MTDLKGWGVVAHQQIGRKDMQELLLAGSSLRWVAVSAGPTAFNWDLGNLERFIENILSERSFRPVFGLHNGNPDFKDIPKWHQWCQDTIDLLKKHQYGSGLIILDAETSNPIHSPPGGVVEYIEAIDPVIDMIHEAGYLAMGPGNVNAGDVVAEYRHLGFILEELQFRGKPIDIPTIHVYPDQGKWDEYETWLRRCETVIRSLGYDWAAIGETGVAGDPWGFWEKFLAAFRIGNGQGDWSKRQYDRIGSMRAVMDRHPFYRAAFFYQIIDGSELHSPNADWGLTSERYGHLRGKQSIMRFQNDPLPDPEPYPTDPVPKPDPNLVDKVRTDFLKMFQPDKAPWPTRAKGYTTTGEYGTLSPVHRAEMIKALRARGYTHIVVTARESGGLGDPHNYYREPEKLTEALKELLTEGLQPILFLSVDDDSYIRNLSTDDRIDLFLSGLKHWAPYCSSVCPSIEWDEWGTRDALVKTVRKIKNKYPDLFVWVHFLSEWTEVFTGGWRGYERFPNADGLFYQQPPDKVEGGQVVDRPPYPHIHSHTKELARRCKRDDWAFCHAEYRQRARHTEAEAIAAGNAGAVALKELGLPVSFANGGTEEDD